MAEADSVGKHVDPVPAPYRSSARDRLLDTAATMFAKHGLEGVSIRAIAKAADVQLPTIYRNFGDKHALYVDACSFVFGEKSAKYEIMLRTSEKADRKLLRFVAVFYKDLLEDPRHGQLFIREVHDNRGGDIQLHVDTYFKRQFDMVTDCCGTLLGNEKAHAVSYMIYVLALGHFQLAPLGRAIPVQGVEWADPLGMARLILTTLIPGVRWTRVRIGHADTW